MMATFKNTFVFEPSKQHVVTPPDYKPEIDITDLCNNAEKDQYWKYISDMKWGVALGCIDIMYANIVLS